MRYRNEGIQERSSTVGKKTPRTRSCVFLRERYEGGDSARDEGQPGPTWKRREKEMKKKKRAQERICATPNKTGKAGEEGVEAEERRSERAEKR
jgi:hypothetical protein